MDMGCKKFIQKPKNGISKEPNSEIVGPRHVWLAFIILEKELQSTS